MMSKRLSEDILTGLRKPEWKTLPDGGCEELKCRKCGGSLVKHDGKGNRRVKGHYNTPEGIFCMNCYNDPSPLTGEGKP